MFFEGYSLIYRAAGKQPEGVGFNPTTLPPYVITKLIYFWKTRYNI